MRQPVIVGLGEVLWDVYPDASHFGGAPANFACHASRLGGDAHIVSAVGRDDLGQQAIDSLKKHGVKIDALAHIDGIPTGTVQVTLNETGHPSYEICKNVAWDAIPWTDAVASLAKRTDAVCFGSLGQRDERSRQVIQQFLEATPEDSLRIFDINLRQDFYSGEIIEQSLELANVLKLNEDELPIVADLLGLKGDQETLLTALHDRFSLRAIALTLGGDGSILSDGSRVSRSEAPSIEVIDTVGAGDSFTAAMAIGLLHQLPRDEINRRAGQIAAYVCTQRGATPQIPQELIDSL